MSVTNPCSFFFFFSPHCCSASVLSHTLSHIDETPCRRRVVRFQSGPKIAWKFLSHVEKYEMTHLSSLFPPFLPLLIPGPHFVAVNNKNEIVVTDFHNHSVKVGLAEAIRIHFK